MREHNGNLAGTDLQLQANFKASMEIAKKVGDPIMIAREANLESMMLEAGMTYHPRWSFTVENVPLILHIGLKHSGSKLTLAEVEELVFEAGFSEAKDLAIEYLAIIIGPRPENPPESDDEENSEGN